MEEGSLAEDSRRYQILEYEQLAARQSSTSGEMNRNDLLRMYDLYQQHPNVLVNPMSAKHSLGRQSFNTKYRDIGLRQMDDRHIQMNMKIPKSYVKSLEPHLRKDRAHIYENEKRVPLNHRQNLNENSMTSPRLEAAYLAETHSRESNGQLTDHGTDKSMNPLHSHIFNSPALMFQDQKNDIKIEATN